MNSSYKRISDIKKSNSIDIDEVKNMYLSYGEKKEEIIKTHIKTYFNYIIQNIISQKDLLLSAKNGNKFKLYPIFIDNKHYKSSKIKIHTKLQISSIDYVSKHDYNSYKNIYWSSGPFGLPIYLNMFARKLYEFIPSYPKYFYISEFNSNIYNIIVDNSLYSLYLNSLKELINIDMLNNYHNFNIKLAVKKSAKIQNIICDIYYLKLSWSV